MTDTFPTHEDIALYSGAFLHPSFPCPTQLYLCIKDINGVRRRAALQESPPNVLYTDACRALRDVAAFNPTQWTERFQLPKDRSRLGLPRVYKSATLLYGMMTVSKQAKIEYPAARRLADAKALVDLLAQEKVKIDGHEVCIAWPLAVAGAALGGPWVPERLIVNRYLQALAEEGEASHGVVVFLDRLLKFWASGKTGWEDCFSTWQCIVP